VHGRPENMQEEIKRDRLPNGEKLEIFTYVVP
jgi:hypothetical protein